MKLDPPETRRRVVMLHTAESGVPERAWRLMSPSGEALPLPDVVAEQVLAVVSALYNGMGVVVDPLATRLTISRVADTFHWTEGEVAALVEKGEFEARDEEYGQTVALADVMAYRSRAADARRKAMEAYRKARAAGEFDD